MVHAWLFGNRSNLINHTSLCDRTNTNTYPMTPIPLKYTNWLDYFRVHVYEWQLTTEKRHTVSYKRHGYITRSHWRTLYYDHQKGFTISSLYMQSPNKHTVTSLNMQENTVNINIPVWLQLHKWNRVQKWW